MRLRSQIIASALALATIMGGITATALPSGAAVAGPKANDEIHFLTIPAMKAHRAAQATISSNAIGQTTQTAGSVMSAHGDVDVDHDGQVRHHHDRHQDHLGRCPSSCADGDRSSGGHHGNPVADLGELGNQLHADDRRRRSHGSGDLHPDGDGHGNLGKPQRHHHADGDCCSKERLLHHLEPDVGVGWPGKLGEFDRVDGNDLWHVPDRGPQRQRRTCWCDRDLRIQLGHLWSLDDPQYYDHRDHRSGYLPIDGDGHDNLRHPHRHLHLDGDGSCPEHVLDQPQPNQRHGCSRWFHHLETDHHDHVGQRPDGEFLVERCASWRDGELLLIVGHQWWLSDRDLLDRSSCPGRHLPHHHLGEGHLRDADHHLHPDHLITTCSNAPQSFRPGGRCCVRA